MVLDPIPQSLPVHFFGSRPQPPTSRAVNECVLRTCMNVCYVRCVYDMNECVQCTCMNVCYVRCMYDMYKCVLYVIHGEVGGWGRGPFSRILMSPTPRRKWYFTTGRRAH